MLRTLQETLGHRLAQCSCCATDRKDRHDCPGCKAEGAQVLICKHCESKHWIDHKLVTPINSERSVQCMTSSVEASRRASPPGLRVRKTNRRPGIRVDRVQGSRETMSIANNIDYGGAFSTIPCAAGAAPSELEVMLMSTVSAVPQGDESFEQGGQRGVKKHASSHDYFKPQSDLQERHQGQIGPDLKCRPPRAPPKAT